MKKIFVFALALLAALLLCAAACASGEDKALVLSHVAEDYPDWRVGLTGEYGSGRWNDTLARHVTVRLYRLEDGQLLQKSLHVLVNPLMEGEPIAYDETDVAPVPLSPGTAAAIEAMTQEEAARALHRWIDTEQLPGCALFMLGEGESWDQLGIFEDRIIGVAEDAQGREYLRVVFWDGESWGEPLSSPAQEDGVWINEIHSIGTDLELMVDHGLVYVGCDEDGTRIDGVNTGWGVFFYADGCVWDVTFGSGGSSSNGFYPGTPTFPLELAEMDLSRVPMRSTDVLSAIDPSGWACVCVNGAEMRTSPDGAVAATCFARLYGRILEEEGEWVLLQIGSAEHGMTGWFRRDDLAFGQEQLFVPCGFPDYDYQDIHAEHLNEVLHGLPAPLEDAWDVWLIGTLPDGDWLVMLEAETVCTAAADAFSDISEPLEYYDPRFYYDWDEAELRELEYIEEDDGLTSLRIVMEDAVFERDSFPSNCYLETLHDGSDILLDYYWDVPADGELPLATHAFMTFSFEEGQWTLEDATDGLTWVAWTEGGLCVFMDYDVGDDLAWMWEVPLDGDLMTFDFVAFTELIDQYNERMPDRPSLSE